MHGDGPTSRQQRLDAAFATEEARSLVLAARVRLLVLLVLTVWVTIENSAHSRFLFYYPFLASFAVLGWAPAWMQRTGRYRAWMRYLFPALDIGLMTLIAFAHNPFDAELLPAQVELRFGNELYVFVFICAAAFTYSPRVVLWTGICAAVAWSAATWWIASLPDSFIVPPAQWATFTADERLRVFSDPRRIELGLWGRQVVLFLVTAAALAVFVARARRLVAQQADAERERANLSRYFSPNLVEELAQSDAPLGATRQQTVTVLFADLVGFTRLAEALPPAAVIDLLREFHGRMQQAVFAHGGTVDKYIGDAVMATFGTPHPGPSDATNALRCIAAMRAAVADWNGVRAARGAAPLRLGIGAHHGVVVLGDIGGESRLEFAVLGDTVNVASRLERLTRGLAADAVISDALVAAARREGGADRDALLAHYAPGAPAALRGRAEPVAVWVSK